MRTALALCCVLLWALPAHAQSERVFKAVVAGAIAAHGADLAVSMYGLGQGTAREANPLLSPLERRPLAFGVVKTGFATVGVAVAVDLWRRGKRKTALVFALGQAVGIGLVAAHNARVVRTT
jgi:hypothetical protein